MHKSLNEFEFRPDPTNIYGQLTMKKIDVSTFLMAIDLILFKLAGNEDVHNILNEFEFQFQGKQPLSV